jgi:hypothetical protein
MRLAGHHQKSQADIFEKWADFWKTSSCDSGGKCLLCYFFLNLYFEIIA